MKGIRYVALVGAFSLGLIGSVTAPVSAATAANTADTTEVTVPMTVMEIDEEVAAKAGNPVVIDGNWKVLYDGQTGAEIARVPVDPSAPTTQSIVYGNCGSSYYWLKDKLGDNNYEFATGFDVPGDAYDFNWRTVVHAEWESGSYDFEWGDDGPQVPGPSWTSGWVEDDTPAPPRSDALRSCYSWYGLSDKRKYLSLRVSEREQLRPLGAQ